MRKIKLKHPDRNQRDGTCWAQFSSNKKKLLGGISATQEKDEERQIPEKIKIK